LVAPVVFVQDEGVIPAQTSTVQSVQATVFGCVFSGRTGRRVPCLVTCWDDFIECTHALYLVWLLLNEKVAAPMNGFGEVTTIGKQTKKTMNSTHT